MLAAVGAAAVLFSAACGGGDGETLGATGSPATSGLPTTPAATQSVAGSPTMPPVAGLVDVAYIVSDGDTVGTIAERWGVTLESILAANELADESQISIGQILKVPGVDATLAGAVPADPNAESPIGIHLVMPLAGACITNDDEQMPNAPREYRNGLHEGIDFFTGFACIDVPDGLDALSAADGVVVRADQEYKQLTQQQILDLEAETVTLGYTPAGTLDKFRGRQVWIDHGDGIMTRYCHLGSIPPEIQPGVAVVAGQTIGHVGDSGTPESIEQAGYNKHLHFEVRVGDSFLGAGEPPDVVRGLYQAAFGLPITAAAP
jgi:murein DD-endopeptidase MepM/ murein hydrolase activator NlpD